MKITRRSSRSLLWFIFHLASCILLLCACATQPAQPIAVPAIAPIVVGVGNGGTLMMALGPRDPTTLDPALVGDAGSSFIVRQIFSGLVRLDERLQVQGDLAARWDVSADGRTYTFYLRPDARFADGTPISSADVVYSLERASDPQLAPALPAHTYLGDIVGVREKIAGQAERISGLQVIDDAALTIQIDAPKSYFLAKLAYPVSFVVDQRAAQAGGARWTERPNGSGPFTIERWEHDQLLVLMRNINYYATLTKLDRVQFLIGAAASNALVLYEQDKIDIVGVPAYALARVADPSSPLAAQLKSMPQLDLSYIGMNVTLPPFDDLKVRQAFTLLIDRAKLSEVTLNHTAEPARGILPPGMPGYNAQLPLGQSDGEQARTLIAASRYGSPAALPPIVAYGGWAATLREVVQRELSITIEVRAYEEYGDYLAALGRAEFQIYGSGWVADYPDPENFLDLLFRGGSAENHSGYANPQLDALLDQAAIEPDWEQRQALYQQAEQQILADAVVIPLYHSTAHTLVKPYVHGLEITSMGILDLASVELAR